MNLSHLFDLSLIGRRDREALEWRGSAFAFASSARRFVAAGGTLAGKEVPV